MLLGSLYQALECGGQCPFVLAEDQVMQVKAFLASVELQISPWGETQAGDRNSLQCLCSFGWGRSAADGAFNSPSHPQFSQFCWHRGAASTSTVVAASLAHTLAALPDLILNIYWTFGLMPFTWEVSYMIGIKAKVKLFARGCLTKKQSLFVTGNTHLWLFFRHSPQSDNSVVLFFKWGLFFRTCRTALLIILKSRQWMRIYSW